MLYLFGFDKVGVAVSDLYFLDPEPPSGDEGAERGVRLEVRLLELGENPGSIYAARPITAAQPVWRADLLETVDGTPGSFNRTHHHPAMVGWEPHSRAYEPDMSADPVKWVGEALSDLPALLARAGLSEDVVGPNDVRDLREAVPEILEAINRLLERIQAGQLALAPVGAGNEFARVSWL